MFAPRLLVSPDLVPQAALVGLAPARSARPSVPSRPQRPLQSGPIDGITQRDIYRIAQLEDLVPRPRVHARYIGGIREVHRVPTPEYRTDQLRTVLLLALRPGTRCPRPCALTRGRMSAARLSAEGAPGI